MAPPRKPSWQRTRKDRKFDVVDLTEFRSRARDEVPALPGRSEMMAATGEDWDAFWSSAVASAIVLDETDLPALIRLFELRDEYRRTKYAYSLERVVKGSQGQPVISPLFAAMNGLLKEVRALEDRFGLSPQARLRLSIEMGEAAKSLDELNGRISDTEGVADPRVDPDVTQ